MVLAPPYYQVGARLFPPQQAIACNRLSPLHLNHVVSTVSSSISRRSYKTGPQPLVNARVRYANWRIQSGDVAEADDITVRAALEYPSGTYYPLYVNNSRDLSIVGGETRDFDPLGVYIPANTQFWIRTYVSVADNTKVWAIEGRTTKTALGEGGEYGDPATDKTTSGSITVNATQVYAPLAIISSVAVPQSPCIAVIGDSISAGLAIVDTGDADFNIGWAERWIAPSMTMLNLSRASERASHADSNAEIQKRMRALDGIHFTHAICALGHNDFANNASLSSIQTSLQAAWGALAAIGLPVYQTTITPKTLSTDSWATTQNQAVPNPANEAVRLKLNAWIRDRPSPLTDFIDVADCVETYRNSSIWKVDGTASKWTSDGIHPTAYGHSQIASLLPNVGLIFS